MAEVEALSWCNVAAGATYAFDRYNAAVTYIFLENHTRVSRSGQTFAWVP